MTGILKKSYAAVAAAVLIVSIYFIAGVLILSGIQYNEINAGNLEEAVRTLGALTPASVFTDKESARAWVSAFENPDAGMSKDEGFNSPYRITLINRNGQVLFDTETDSSAMENHLDRPEFQTAITGGIGSERRKSASLGQDYIYAAIGIKPAGTYTSSATVGKNEIAGVLRLSRLVPSFSSRLLLLAPPFLLGGFLLIVATCAGLFRFSRRLSSSIEVKLDAELKSKNRELLERAKEAEDEGLRRKIILDSMSDGVIALDSKLKIILVNPRVCSFFGIDTQRNVQGLTLLEFSSSIELEKAASEVLNSGQPVELTLKRYVSAVEQHFQVFAAPLGSRQGVVIVLSDISRIVKLELVRKDFAANVSHELRTPIQVIKGFAENILESATNDKNGSNKKEICHFAGIIAKNTMTMENITNDLLTLVSLEDEDTGRPSMELFYLSPLIAEAADMVKIPAAKKNISIETSCPQDLSVKLYDSLFVQALINLMDNGIKYSNPGSSINVSAFLEGEQLVVEVKDKGIGIPAGHMGRIFERFYRVDRARSREAGGTGLGLAIVRHIAKLHGGSAEAESHAGEGSTFRLKLPK